MNKLNLTIRLDPRMRALAQAAYPEKSISQIIRLALQRLIEAQVSTLSPKEPKA